MKRALLVPADTTKPCTLMDWDGDRDLLTKLYSAIGCSTVDAVGITLHGVGLTIWVDDEGLFLPAPARNARIDRLLAMASTRPWAPLVGNAVVTGGPDPEGETLGVPTALLGQLQAALDQPAPAV